MTRWSLLLLAVLAGASLLAAGCDSETSVTVAQPAQTGIAVEGEGRVTVVPDIGEVRLGVQTTRGTVAEARSAAATAMDAVRASVRKNGVDDRDIVTSGFSIYPQYGVSRDGSPPRISGYMAQNQVTVKVRRIDDTAKVLDDAVAAGGDAIRVNGVSFTVSDPEKYHAEAREKAFEDAKKRAEQLAKLSDANLGKPLYIAESGDGGGAFPRVAAAEGRGDEGGLPTPLAPGETEIVLGVSVTFAIE